MFDEPELHINTAIQRKLLHAMNDLVGEHGQIWIATHSIGFLRALQDDFAQDSQVIQFSESLNLFTETVKLEPIEKNHYQWRQMFQTALDDLSGLVSPKRIIYCEGRDTPTFDGQERGMDAKVFNTIFNTTHPDTLFVSSGGNTELDQRSAIAIAVLNKALPDVEIWVFKDRDIASGKLVAEEDRIEYLKNQTDMYRVMKRWEIENYLFDKEVLQAYCAQNNKEFNKEKYLAIMTDKNIYNDDVKSLGSEFTKTCSITTSINQDKFKENLAKCITSNTNVYKELESCIFHRE